MKSIGFKNFRKFENFDPIKLGSITVLVGGNNAGKSTVVKAILSILDFLNTPYFNFDRRDTDGSSILNQNFYFDRSYFAHIGTFKRALYNKAKSNIISFSFMLDNVFYELDIEGDPFDEESTCGRLIMLRLTQMHRNIQLHFDFINDDIHVIFNQKPHPKYTPSNTFNNRRKWAHKEEPTLEEYFASVPKNAELHMPISGDSDLRGGSIIECLCSRFTSKIVATIELEDPYSNKAPERVIQEWRLRNKALALKGLSEEMKSFLMKNKSLFRRYNFLDMPFLYDFWGQSNIEYIYAHAVTQSVIYSAKDTNDYFVKTIHEFADPKIQARPNIHKFVTEWMKKFHIGEDFNIKSVGGEAHIVKIIAKDGSSVNLADKGMGSIQLMILLFRLATKLSFHRHVNEDIDGDIIIIEEPEQNLHPQLQSRLADLFYEMNQKHKFRFIIETHSEYLIRETQVIVKNNFNDTKCPLTDNPFKVYYFNSKSKTKPYFEMQYQKDGNFANDFGTGFFDEASKLAFSIL